MNLLIFFSVVFATIIFAIILERLIRCPILVGFAFFSIFLIVSAVQNNITLVIVAIILGILAFIVAFLDCIFRRTGFLRNNGCISCENDNNGTNENSTGISVNNCGCNCENNSNDTLTILNSNGRVVARIDGNNITCLEDTDCGCSGRNNRYRRY